MSWLSNFVRPKIQALIEKKEVPDNLWHKCSSCEKMIFHRDLEKHLYVCTHCGYHMRLTALQRLKMLFDNEEFSVVPVSEVPTDPLKYRDIKKYTDRLKEARAKDETLKEVVLVGKGNIEGLPVVAAAFDFRFIGGSMGMHVGESIVKAAEAAVHEKCPLVLIPASGGARMQEGILSLMQMARTTVGVEMVKDAGLPYVVILTDPTTGGVSASFAMIGDITIAEPGAIIGFTGARVIEQTIRQKLPDGFQRAEYLLEHGMVDMVIPRFELKKKLGDTLKILLHK